MARLRYCPLNGPAATQPYIRRGRIDTGQRAPFREGPARTINCYPAGAPSVARLFGGGRPSHVTRLIVSIVVDPVETVTSRWASANIAQKICERGAPPIAHPNASSTIQRPVLVAGIETTLLNGSPQRVLIAALSRFAVSCHTFAVKAAARCRVARDHRVLPNGCQRAAVAATNPIVFRSRSRLDQHQSPKSHSSPHNVLCRHAADINTAWSR